MYDRTFEYCLPDAPTEDPKECVAYIDHLYTDFGDVFTAIEQAWRGYLKSLGLGKAMNTRRGLSAFNQRIMEAIEDGTARYPTPELAARIAEEALARLNAQGSLTG